ncbi:MAG: fasciclin domain-containing protein [Deinococcales bacterium]|jgi:uncharacterized surface protein with fasciclin (FAS1) repeats
MHRTRTLLISLVVALVVTASAASAQTIVGIAASNPQFSTLVKAVQAAGLVDTLNGPGPFTVFAPTDAAFAKLPAGQLDALLADKQALVKVLTYHVVPGKLMAADVVKLRSATTAEGEPITITTSAKGVMVDDAQVTATDIVASNGVIHVIDSVILPPSLTAAGTNSVAYPLAAVGDSGVSGTATLDKLGSQTLVTLNVTGTPGGGDHPAHIHVGDCQPMGPVAYPLTNVDGSAGMSSTLVDVPLATLLEGNFSLRVHLAPDKLSTVVACGEVGGGAPSLSN